MTTAVFRLITTWLSGQGGPPSTNRLYRPRYHRAKWDNRLCTRRELRFPVPLLRPRVGVPEDHVTGSAHCVLTPYWAARLGKARLHARQVSARGGELWCELAGDRVKIAGHAVLYLKGEISA